MSKTRRRKSGRSRPSRSRMLSNNARLTEEQINFILLSYAERRSPKAAAQASGLSRNTIYAHYNRIRWRLVISRYYDSGALSCDEPGLAPEISRKLRMRRGIRKDEIYPHAAELIDWAEQWPPRLTLKHIRKITALTGPLDEPPELSDLEAVKLQAYVRYARTELVYWRLNTSTLRDEAQRSFIDRTKAALDNYWRDYRAASKRLERSEHKTLSGRADG